MFLFRYLILNVKTGGVIDLFPIEEHSTSYMITQIQNQEFLVAGKKIQTKTIMFLS